ncbi:RES family NAD+ phosphorylase [Rhodoglobus aureus]|uniref:RES domain-containing protein n=1 Tax=Rhodoglobus aureus TaxID=191497 RepID=A0ABP4G749_9MICO
MEFDPVSFTDDALCLSHISDQQLLRRLSVSTEDGECLICAAIGRPQSGSVVNFERLAQVVYDTMLRAHDHDGLYIDGEQLLDPLTTEEAAASLLADAIELDVLDAVTETVVSLIHDDVDWFIPYDMDYEAGVQFEWNDFEDSVKHESRMLTASRGAQPESAAEKNYAFVKSLLVLAEERMGLVRVFERGTKVYRARIERDALEFEAKAKKAPARELGAAPRDRASAGRMNAQGVPMFYVALDAATACAEVAAHSPYDEVVVGTFVVQQPLRILDLTTVPPTGSIFDDAPKQDGDERLTSLGFYVERITQPVILDGSHPVDYAPTQVLTDAFREWAVPRLDGIAYPSRVSEGGGTNVVLFYSDRMWFESPDEPSTRFERMVREVEHGRKTSLFRVDPKTIRRYRVNRQISVNRSKPWGLSKG